MSDKLLSTTLFLVTVTGVLGGEFCQKWEGWNHKTTWCDNGCCGDDYDQDCCIDAETGMIIGIVIGSIAFVALVATVLVVIFCCLRKSRGRAGHVHNPQAGATATTTTTVAYPGQVTYPTQPGYPGQMAYSTVTTSNMAPGVQTWQQPPPPPSYSQVEQKV